MKCVVLQNPDGGHLGFMLCSPDLDQPAGDCVFMGLPSESELFHREVVELLMARHDAGESQWRVAKREPLSVLVQTPGIFDELYIQFEDQEKGMWGVRTGSGGQVLGRAFLVAQTKSGTGPVPAR